MTDTATATKPTLSEQAVAAAVASRPKFTVKSHVTRQLIKIVAGTEYFFRAESAIYDAPEESGGRKPRAGSAAEAQKPPKLLNVIELTTKTVGVVVVPHVLNEELTRFFPDNGYVGKDFYIIKHAMEEGKKYSTFTIQEIEMEDEPASAPATTAKKK